MSAPVAIEITADDKASSVFGSLADTMGGVLNIAGKVAGGVVDMFKSVIDESMQAQEGQSQLASVLESTGHKAGVTADQANQLASALQLTTKFTDDQVLSTENMLLTFTNIGKDVFPDVTKTALNMSQALGQDTKASAIQLGKALNDPIKGISALSKVGVAFTQEQKDQIKVLVEAGDTMGAQKIILGELNTEFGGAAEAAGKTFGGQMAILSHQFDDVKQQIGDALLPVLGQLMGYIGTVGLPILQSFGQWMGTHIPIAIAKVQAVLAPIGSLLRTLSDDWSGAGDATNSFTERLGYTIDTLLGVEEDIQGPFQTAVLLMQATINDVTAAFSEGGLGGALGAVATKLAALSPTFALIKVAVDAAIPPIKDIVLTTFGIIGSFITEHGDKIKADLTGAWQQIQDIINAVTPPIQAIVQSVFGAVATFLHAHGDDIKATLGDTWDRIATIIKTALELIKSILVPVLTFIAKFIKDHGAEIQAIISATWTAIKAVIDAALTLIQGVITVALDIIHGDWSKAWEDIKAMSARIVQDIISVLQADFEVLKTLFGSTVKSVVDAWNALPAQLANVGGAIVAAIQSGFESAWENFKAAMLKKLADLRAQLPFSEPKDSSSPLYGLSKSGASIVRNMQEGIDGAPALRIGGPVLVSGGRSSGGGSSRSGGGNTSIGGGGTTMIFHIDARGATMSQKEYEASTRKVLLEAGTRALSRQLTGN